MQQVSPEFIAAAANGIVSPQYRFSASWLRQSIFGAYFTIGVSHIGLGDVIKGEGNNPAESSSYVFTDETPYVISLDIDRQLVEPAYSISQALADIVLDNTSDRFTPNFDPVIGGSIVPQRPVRINTGFLVSGIQQLVQSFTGQISDYPVVDSQNRQVTIHAIDYSQIIQNVSLVNAILQQNKTTGQIITFLFQLAGLAASQYQVDPGSITIPYAFFSPGQTIGDVITKVAECEGASVYLDENDVSRYETRNVWLDAPRTNRRHLRTDINTYTSAYTYWQPPPAPVSPSTVYWCSLRYRSNMTYNHLTAEYFNGTSYTTEVLAFVGISGSPFGSWKKITASVTTPSDCISMRFFIDLQSAGYMETDDYYLTLIQGSTSGSLIPNFSSELGTPGANLATNGDFEVDVSGWTTYVYSTDSPPTVTHDSSVSFNGLSSAKIVTSGFVTGYQGITQTITGLTIGTQYNISLGLYALLNTGDNIEIAFGSTGTNTTLVGGAWTPFSFTTIATSTSLVIRVGNYNTNSTMWLDSVIVTSGNGGTPTGWSMIQTGTTNQTFYWANRGQSDISLLLTDDLVKNDEQYNPQQNTIINSVTVTANPRKPVSTAVVMFSLAVNDSRLVPAGGTASVLCGYVDAQNIPLPFTSLTTPTAGGANSFWIANSAADGSGSNQTSNLTLSSFTNYSTNSVALFSNATGSDIYITQLQVKGISVPITQQIVTTVEDATSIAQYGKQTYPINNDYIQTYAQAQLIASNLIHDRKDQAIYRVFTIVGQPHLQLGDRIRRNSIDYFILRIKQSQNASSGLVQEIWAVSRPAYP